MSSPPFDGNASAGDMAEVFAFDVTMARTTCAFCGDTRPLAELHAYMWAPGTVLRCATCENVQVRFVRADDRAWVELTGVKVLQLPAASA
jgi:ribosomal protein S27E